MGQWMAINNQLSGIFVFDHWSSFKAPFKRQKWGIRKGFARLKLYPETKHESWRVVRFSVELKLNWEEAKKGGHWWSLQALK